MFSQRSIMIGFIILIVACLVMYGCSSTSIKEGISNFGGNSAYYTSAKTGDGYIYSTEAEADAACKSVGWDGLCRKVDVPTKCACGWYAGATAADVGYHMDANTTHWGTGGCGGTSTDWITCAGKGGAYCCGDGPEVAALNPGYLPGDDLAHEGSNYIYKTQAEAETACKAAGWDGLCKKKDVPSKCAAGWYAGATPDDVGYHMDPNTPGWGDVGCGDGSTGWIPYFPGGKAGAYCCGGGPKCPNLSGSWSSTTGGYTVKITQDNCDWTAISPSQPWSPARGKVSGTNLISSTPGLMPAAAGWTPAKLSGNPVNSIAWDDGDTWTRKSPPSSTRVFISGELIGIHLYTDQVQLWTPLGKAGGTINGPTEITNTAASPAFQNAQNNTLNSILIDKDTTFTMYSGENGTGKSWTRTGPILLWGGNGDVAGMCEGCADRWKQMGGSTTVGTQTAWNGKLDTSFYKDSTLPEGCMLEWMGEWCCKSSGGSFQITTPQGGSGTKCPNLSGSWSAHLGYTAKITQENCNFTVTASPQQWWSPAHGTVTNDKITLFNDQSEINTAPLSGDPVNSFTWVRHEGSADPWTRKSPPSSTPQMLCVTGAAIGKTGISPNGTYTLQSDNPPWWLMQSSVNDGTINWTISQGSVEEQTVVPKGTWWFLCGYKDRVPSGGGGSGAGDALGCWNSSQIVGTKPVSALKLPPMGVWKVGQGTDAGDTEWQSFKGNICLSKCPPPKNACPNLDKNACVPGFYLPNVGGISFINGGANTKEDCHNLCNNTSSCNYWGWYPKDLTRGEISAAGFTMSKDIPGACWTAISGSELGNDSGAHGTTNEVYQKLCNWGGKKNCSFTNVPKCPRDAPPKCPDGWEQVGGLGADIQGPGMDPGSGGRWDKNNIQQCADWCTAAGNQCKSFNWVSPVIGDCSDEDRAAGCRIGGTQCTRYTSDIPNYTDPTGNPMIMCKPSAPPPKGCGSNCCTVGGDTVNGQCCCNSNTTCGGEDCSYYDDGSGGGGGGVGSGTLSLGKNAILLNVDKYSKKL